MKNKLMILILALGVMSQATFAASTALVPVSVVQNLTLPKTTTQYSKLQGICKRTKAMVGTNNLTPIALPAVPASSKRLQILQTKYPNHPSSILRASVVEKIAPVMDLQKHFEIQNNITQSQARKSVFQKFNFAKAQRDEYRAAVASFVHEGGSCKPGIKTLRSLNSSSSFASKIASFMNPKAAVVVAGGSLATAGGWYAYNNWLAQEGSQVQDFVQKAVQQDVVRKKVEPVAVKAAHLVDAVKNSSSQESRSFVAAHKGAIGSGIVIATIFGYLAYKKGWFKKPFGKAVQQKSNLKRKK